MIKYIGPTPAQIIVHKNLCYPPKKKIRLSLQTLKRAQTQLSPGGRLNKKDGLTRYGDSHVKDKTS